MKRLLIANRGEIAVRVIRACREMGIEAVAVYGQGEEEALHVKRADDAYLLPADAALPYLNIPAIIEIAKRSDADAVHPGYGFLAENADFSDAVREAGLVFVGPSAESMRAMGDKIGARAIAKAAGVPVVPGSDGPVDDLETARAWATEFGYPVAFKATAGGGGRGFRVAKTEAELDEAYTGSSSEGSRYFGNGIVYLERYLQNPRHIEMQIFGDQQGNLVWLGERDCSVQRRHQKLIEESPSPGIDNELRQSIGQAAVNLARSVDYLGAGTCEFMVIESGEFYFLEMNTRIQVEHTVTEEVTGIDLVKEQIRVASGDSLSFTQESVQHNGHAIECRINAEDAGRDFKPMPGVVTTFIPPDGPGIRTDSAFAGSGIIPPTYDSLIAKLIARGKDRPEAIARMRRALDEFVIEGVPSLIPFHRNVMAEADFQAGNYSTAYLPTHPEVIPEPASSPSVQPDEAAEPRSILVEVGGRRFDVRVHDDGLTPHLAAGPAHKLPRAVGKKKADNSSDSTSLLSPIQGTIVRVPAASGSKVSIGDLICVIEAMKMENEISAHREGTITALPVATGASIRIGDLLATIE